MLLQVVDDKRDKDDETADDFVCMYGTAYQDTAGANNGSLLWRRRVTGADWYFIAIRAKPNRAVLRPGLESVWVPMGASHPYLSGRIRRTANEQQPRCVPGVHICTFGYHSSVKLPHIDVFINLNDI